MRAINNAFFRTYIFFLSGAFPFLFLFCHARVPVTPIGAEHIADAFVNQSPAFERALVGNRINAVQWDSCVKAAMKICIGPAGTFAQSLFDSTGVEYTLGWKTPARIRQDTTYPLIIYLHGGTSTQLITKGEKAYDMLSPLADSFKLFLASPSANRFTPWWSPQGIWRILQTLRFMTLRYPINPAKVFLAGVSDGATGCYAVANTACGPFAGFFAISGFGGMLPQVSMDLIPANIMQRPIYNVNAGKDRIYAIAQVKMFLNWLMARGVRVEASANDHVRDFLSDLATCQRVSASTQKQALTALVFLLREALERDPGEFGDFVRARKSVRLPVVLSREECQRLFAALDGTMQLMAELMYGSGLRLMELLRLWVKDVDLERGQILVRAGKGDKDRVTVLPLSLSSRLREHRNWLRRLYDKDRQANLPGVWIPEGLDRKYPKAGDAWEWQWFFPSRELMTDPRSGLRRRHHVL